MKLLIVDDEELTREGLLTSFHWETLGINHIFLADDGVNGLNIAKKEKPDILLCDVRMPRMDGIQMAMELEQILPDINIIFMSGYSDKEYLKAAIKLKAITYVEKPLDLTEVKEAILDARDRYQQKLRSRKSETLYSSEAASQFATLLTKPYKDSIDKITELTGELGLRITHSTSTVSYIVRLESSEPDMTYIDQIQQDLKDALSHYHLQVYYTHTHTLYHVFHVICDSYPSSMVLKEISKHLTDLFLPLKRFYICQGKPQQGIARTYNSYASAVLLLQNSFYYEEGSVLVWHETNDDTPSFSKRPYDDLSHAFAEILLAKDEEKCTQFLDVLHHYYFKNDSLLPPKTKDDYYKLFSTLNDCRQKMKLSSDSYVNHPEENIMEYLVNCFSFEEMHQTLTSKMKHIFEDLNAHVPEDSTIFLIKEYISKNYMDESLSIKNISDHVFLSTSYVCTYFKNQTGTTLNQFLTEYRMERAKQLLGDQRYQITDISSKVGYSNGNYFSKSFKKYTGLTPSKYREKMIG